MALEPDDIEPLPEPLLEAVRTGDLEAVRRLLGGGTEGIDDRNHIYEHTALELAIAMERLDIARVLLDHGADPNAPSANDADALGVAVTLPRDEAHPLVELLLARGARPTGPAILAAAGAGDLWATDRLLAALPPDAPADHDAVNGTLLAAAVRLRDADLVERVLARWGSPLPDFHVQWAFEAAADTGHVEMWERLLALGAPHPERALRAAVTGFARDGAAGQLEILGRVAAQGGPALAGSLFASAVTIGQGPSERSEALVEVALRSGGDVDPPGGDGATALLRAADRHDVAQMRRLVELGADRHARDDAGRGLWEYVHRWPESVNLPAARAFLDELGIPEGDPWRDDRAPPRGDGLAGCAVLVGLAIGVVIVLVVLLAHAC